MAPSLFGSPLKSNTLILPGIRHSACGAFPGESDITGLFFAFSCEYITLALRVNFSKYLPFVERVRFVLSNAVLGIMPLFLKSAMEKRKLCLSLPPLRARLFVQVCPVL